MKGLPEKSLIHLLGDKSEGQKKRTSSTISEEKEEMIRVRSSS